MANEFITVLRPRDFTRLNGPLNTNDLAYTNSGAGLRLLKSDVSGFVTIFVPPAENTQGTGITFSLGVVDDGDADAASLGKVIRLGITVKKLVSGTDTLDIATNAATETTVDVTLDATTGEIVLGSSAIANAALDSVGVGDTALLRIRRIGTHANDTAPGTAILTHVYIRNT